MKKIILACFLTFSVATTAMAGWTETFVSTYQEKGIELAVKGALTEGQTPALIIDEGLKIKELNPRQLLMALYCAGADGKDINKAAEDAGISDVLLVDAYEKSVAECGDQMSDSQAYTPAGTNAPTFAGLPALTRTQNRAGYASPSTFH
ncbi:MAG: hypothetical protein KKB91_10810 [Proteobacteria bacterium]|jgi:hypothetical protein|nr:hypothetical protein [Desulfocapsa sp.]MBU3945581.1 hypothetical protein [Pseudomonadota bacterium]MCG2745143.1 hypothetical protein [Desulfobacteraceae bacterium]MBU4029788.1 hypothetical protein [Pseudomonadota bacterium]MBU4041611.1 hypothetical protein [Pseudomonadota bacterium]